MQRDYARIARGTTLTLLLVLALASFGNTVIGTVNTLVGADLAGNEELAGLPSAMIQVGAAVASLLLGATMDRFGRRPALAGTIAVGALGALVGGIAILNGSFFWFLAASVLIGFTRAGSLMGRFVAAEVNPPETRGRAISYVILGGTFGSVFGPLLAGPTGSLAESFQFDAFTGPFAAGILFFIACTVLLLVFLRPEPRDVAVEVAALNPPALVHTGPARPILEILRHPTAFVAVIAMIFGQVVMVGLMTITPLEMRAHDHSLSAISLVFSSHTFGMFAFSIVTGQLLDRWGRGPVILAGAAILLVSSAMAPIWPDVLPLAVSLFLLGLGWNFCYIGGSTLLSDILTPEERSRTQGANELLISLMTALSSFFSGVVFASGGYLLVGWIGIAASIFPLALTGWWMARREPAPVG